MRYEKIRPNEPLRIFLEAMGVCLAISAATWFMLVAGVPLLVRLLPTAAPFSPGFAWGDPNEPDAWTRLTPTQDEGK